MSNDTSEEKTENPTSHRLKLSQKEGNNRYSRELYSLFILTVMLSNFWFNKVYILNLLKQVICSGFTFDDSVVKSNFFIQDNFMLMFYKYFITLLKSIFMPILIFIIPSIVLSCASFNVIPIKFNISKLNPFSGFKKIFSIKSVVDTCKTIFKIIVVGTVIFLFVYKYFLKICIISTFTFNYILNYSIHAIFFYLYIILVCFIPIAIVDSFWERYNFYKSLRMTRKEVSDDFKNTEGNPYIKSRIRRAMFALSSRRMLSNVSKSDVIVVNPTHYAIAIQYDDTAMSAPKILAKGIGELAKKIKQIGNNHSIPVLASYPLAHVLYYHTEVGEYIPILLYSAVAEVLAWVWKIRYWKKKGGVFPHTPSKITVPPELYSNKKRTNKE